VLFTSASTFASPHRVVITGVGIITPFGKGWEVNAAGFRSGRSTFAPITRFDASRQRVKVAAEVSELDSCSLEFPNTNFRRLEGASRMLLIAAQEAWNQAGWQSGSRLPVVLGSTSGGMTLGETYYRQSLISPPVRKGQAIRVLHYQPHQQGLDVARALGFSGPILVIANACASGANAIGHAFEMVKTGRADQVLTGGYDSLSQLVFGGFDALQALSPTTCRPFDATRDGLGLGEGAGVLAVESLEFALKRGAEVLGEIVGYGCAMDLHHLTQPHPQGDAALASMTMASDGAKISPSQVGYINAHGTGTLLNDAAEAAAINRWGGDAVGNLNVSSTKSSIGHTLGAAGALEALVCLMALQGQWMPPTLGIQSVDPACQFRLVTEPTDARLEYALTNSFGFGGANATLILRRWS
jgi:3-oxoacyl-[acyl-carrier-protein] synthase II